MNEPLRVYYDGLCVICRASRSWVERRDRNNLVNFVDFRDIDDADLPTSRELLLSNVVAVSGSLSTGYDAWCNILELLPRWRFVAPLLRLAGLSWVGRMLYRFIAANRFRLGGQCKGRLSKNHQNGKSALGYIRVEKRVSQ